MSIEGMWTQLAGETYSQMLRRRREEDMIASNDDTMDSLREQFGSLREQFGYEAPRDQMYVGRQAGEAMATGDNNTAVNPGLPDIPITATPTERQAPQTKATTKNKFAIGQAVKIHSFGYGMGAAKKGDIGIVHICHGDGTLTLLLEDGNIFYCDEGDVKALPKEESRKYALNLGAKQEAFYKACAIALPYNRNEVESKLMATKDALYNMQRELLTKHEQVNELSTLYNSARSRASNASVLQQVRRYAQYICTKYEKITYGENDTIEAITNHIEYFAPKHPKMKVVYGKYKVVLALKAKDVTVFAMDTKSMHKNGYSHPNVQSADGHVCYGTYEDSINGHLATRDISQLLFYMYDLLSNTSDAGAYQDQGWWCTDFTKRCTGCWKLSTECGCSGSSEETCSDCGEHVDDCTCVRCPNDHDRLEDDIFPDSVCLGGCGHYRTDEEHNRHFCGLDHALERDIE